MQMKTMKVHEVHHLGKVLRVGCVGGSDQDPGTDSWSVGLPHSVPPGPADNGGEGSQPDGVCSALENRVPIKKGGRDPALD